MNNRLLQWTGYLQKYTNSQTTLRDGQPTPGVAYSLNMKCGHNFNIILHRWQLEREKGEQTTK